MSPSLVADLIVALHVAYVSFVVGGLIAIWTGYFRGWSWVRNPWFRLAHLAAIVLVASESLLEVPCPLTEWERDYRLAAGEPVHGASFMGRCLHWLIFFDLPEWLFTVIYVIFAAVVAASLWLVPLRGFRNR